MGYFGGIVHDTVHDGLVGAGVGATGFGLAGVIAALIARKQIKAAKGSVALEALENATGGVIGGGFLGGSAGSTVGLVRGALKDPNTSVV